jgi:hypothetical protein
MCQKWQKKATFGEKSENFSKRSQKSGQKSPKIGKKGAKKWQKSTEKAKKSTIFYNIMLWDTFIQKKMKKYFLFFIILHYGIFSLKKK